MNALVIIGEAPNETRLTGALEPATYTSNTSTMFDGGTSVSGKTLGAVVREGITTISMSWRFLTTEQWALINGLFKTTAKSGEKFVNKVRYFDQTTGNMTTEPREMFVSDRNAGMWRQGSDGKVAGWLECSLELTEV